jgi:hypothetical protein
MKERGGLAFLFLAALLWTSLTPKLVLHGAHCYPFRAESGGESAVGVSACPDLFEKSAVNGGGGPDAPHAPLVPPHESLFTLDIVSNFAFVVLWGGGAGACVAGAVGGPRSRGVRRSLAVSFFAALVIFDTLSRMADITSGTIGSGLVVTLSLPFIALILPFSES